MLSVQGTDPSARTVPEHTLVRNAPHVTARGQPDGKADQELHGPTTGEPGLDDMYAPQQPREAEPKSTWSRENGIRDETGLIVAMRPRPPLDGRWSQSSEDTRETAQRHVSRGRTAWNKRHHCVRTVHGKEL